LQPEDYPGVLAAVFVETPTPFFSEFFERLLAMEYPKSRIDVFIHNVVRGYFLQIFASLDSLITIEISDKYFHGLIEKVIQEHAQ
jgi:hypothetical protein